LKRTIELRVSDEELAERRKSWKPRPTEFGSGALFKYAEGVGPARYGAVTHPGGAGETQCYADV
jgi:dihydroxy-acid dehydratase